jgi:hypothetical protein
LGSRRQDEKICPRPGAWENDACCLKLNQNFAAASMTPRDEMELCGWLM